MIRKNMQDYFFTHQPECKFVDDFKSYEVKKVKFSKLKDIENFVAVKSIFIDKNEFLSCDNLITVFEDFERFTTQNKISGNEYPINIIKENGYKKEEFEISVFDGEIVLKAGETEGVRRAVITLEDMIVEGNGNLKKATTHRTVAIKRRFAHSFFSPINRPPRNLEELLYDGDSYFDEYLNRLMHIGVNAVWIYTDLDMLAKSKYFKEFGVDSEKRIAKLNKLTEKCARFGIDVFPFLIGPQSFQEASMIKRYGKEMHEKYKDQVGGNAYAGPQAFCLNTELGKKYLEEAIENILISAPKIGGFMWVTIGERTTHCGNSWPDAEGGWKNLCPHCQGKGKGELTAEQVNIIMSVIKRVAPDKEFVSHGYGFRCETNEEITSFSQKVDKDAKLLYTFEDAGCAVQLGKKRYATDFFLCYPGPSDYFKHCAKEAIANGNEVYAKMQIACSHDLASVLYIPVPGLTYDRITKAKELGVTGVLESWFFGDYPCMITKAVEKLCYNETSNGKEEFLKELSSLYWKKEDVPFAVKAYQAFEEGYINYPVNTMFNYYGPMHDSVVWKLQLLPKNFGLPRTWQLQDSRDGDRIGECLFQNHTLEEAILLTEMVVEKWEEGIGALKNTSEWGNLSNDLISVPVALELLFKSGLNVLKFYKLRDDLGYQKRDAKTILEDMKKIVLEEIEHSEKMIPVCKADNRIGYHSEAEGYKFFPEQLEDRIKYLKNLLETEFKEVEERIEKGQTPLAYYDGVEEGITSIKAGRKGLESAEWGVLQEGQSKFRIAVDEEQIEIEIVSELVENFFFNPEYRLGFPETSFVIKHDGNITFWRDADGYHGIKEERRKKHVDMWKVENLSTDKDTHIIMRVKKKDAGFIKLPFKFAIKSYMGKTWCVEQGVPTNGLGKMIASPGNYGWIK